ncbi:dephospho-CoA kinase [Romboutsia sp. CE17]|uniref:dephospho-CoA kinase n=1 Tax=Romboutsia sp. CE17 TaxID=2724150 RepID=UPI001442B450|nr:dephospho-CoA kinase [Romboutsia sp. CE17]QJA07933.1 dephospho-CoA kinase [Romboutsia sp. CE17]
MLVLGLTGNIGCGKSSLSRIFNNDFNIDIIDADIISRNIFEDIDLLENVFKTFGPKIKNKDGSLNRKALGNIVFNDDNELIKLNNLTHPRIKDQIINKIELVRKSGKKIVVIDAALLIEGSYLDILDKLLVVYCDKDIQIQRIIERDSCSKEEALSRINSQMNQEEKISYGDYIIDNSGTYYELKKRAYEFIDYVKEKWCE